jgi:hypothetical protein
MKKLGIPISNNAAFAVTSFDLVMTKNTSS